MTYKEAKDLLMLKFAMASSASLGLFSAVMIIFHPGQERMNATEKSVYFQAIVSQVFLWIKVQTSSDSKDSQVAIDSQHTNVLTTENIEITEEKKHG